VKSITTNYNKNTQKISATNTLVVQSKYYNVSICR
jgi:hypothetical protein